MTHRTNFKKPRILDKVRRHIQRRKTVSAEQSVMQAVRREDKYCRFPECGCGRLKLTLDVAHAGEQGHRKMGGNSSLSATVPENLILLCRPRHRAHQFAVDKHTLRVEPLTAKGLRGPVRWLIDVSVIEGSGATETQWLDFAVLYRHVEDKHWWLLATETAPHRFEPFTDAQAAILKYLATMEC